MKHQVSQNFQYGYLRLKREKADLVHELERRVEYEEELRLYIEKLEKQVQLCLGDVE